ncbi:MAG: hypothetical protein SFY80_17690 [Verrucomicrobiota bacterium]|nr:hypothetical protein [Verrucomicrobiota bacterium]
MKLLSLFNQVFPQRGNLRSIALIVSLLMAALSANAAPALTQPADVTIVQDDRAVLTAEASGSGTINYQWYTGLTGDTSRPIVGSMDDSYETAPLKRTTSYWVRVTDDSGSTDSATITVTVVTPKQLIKGGIEWLLAHQEENGSWGNEAADTAQALLALLNGGYKEDAPNAVTPGPVSRGLTYLLAGLVPVQVTVDDATVDALYAGGYDTTYNVSMALMTLVATRNADYVDEIAKLRAYLLYSQSKAAGNPYDGAFTYGVGGAWSGDLSNSQWGFFAMRAAENVLNDGKGAIALERAKAYLAGSQGPQGQGYYTVGSGSGFDRCMTSALVWSYALVGYGPEDARVINGLNWLTSNYSWDYENARYYNLVTFSKALVMSHKTKLGDKNWYVDMTRFLLEHRTLEQDGTFSWYSGFWLDHDRIINTAWAVLAMQTRSLPEGTNAAMWITLRSHADLHLYDPEGRHTGKNYTSNQLDNDIPGAALILKMKDDNGVPTGDPLPWPADGVLSEDWAQIIQIPLEDAGTYRVELVGTSDGPFDLTIEGVEDGVVVTSESSDGNITTGVVLSTNVTVTALEGSTTLLYEEIRSLPALGVTPGVLVIDATKTTAQEFTVNVSETGGNEDLDGVNIFANPVGALQGATVTFSKNNFTVTKGTTEAVTVTITLPSALSLPVESGSIRVESAGGGARTIKVSPQPEFDLSMETASFQANGGTGSVDVTATSVTDAEWKAVFNNAADQSWIAITSGSSGIGNGTVQFTVAAGSNRSASLTIAGHEFVINQQGAVNVTFSVDPTSASYGALGGTGNITVTSTPASTANWVAFSPVDWITFPTGSTGQGSGSLSYKVASLDRTAITRTSTFTVASNTVTITQTGITSISEYFGSALVDLGENNYNLPGFGNFYNPPGTFWIYHAEQGWEYLDGAGQGAVIAWDRSMDWVYTSAAIYPFVYRFRDGLWYWFYQPYSKPEARFFYRYTGVVWEEYSSIP